MAEAPEIDRFRRAELSARCTEMRRRAGEIRSDASAARYRNARLREKAHQQRALSLERAHHYLAAPLRPTSPDTALRPISIPPNIAKSRGLYCQSDLNLSLDSSAEPQLSRATRCSFSAF